MLPLISAAHIGLLLLHPVQAFKLLFAYVKFGKCKSVCVRFHCFIITKISLRLKIQFKLIIKTLLFTVGLYAVPLRMRASPILANIPQRYAVIHRSCNRNDLSSTDERW